MNKKSRFLGCFTPTQCTITRPAAVSMGVARLTGIGLLVRIRMSCPFFCVHHGGNIAIIFQLAQ